MSDTKQIRVRYKVKQHSNYLPLSTLKQVYGFLTDIEVTLPSQ